DRHQDEAEQKACDSKKSADALLQDPPQFFHQRWKGPLEIRNLFFYISLNALAFGGRKLRWVRRNCLRRGCDRSRRCRRVWRSGRSRSRLHRRRRRGRAVKPVCETGRGRLFASSAQKSERLVESIDKVEDSMMCAFRIGRVLPCKFCVLDGEGRYEPVDELIASIGSTFCHRVEFVFACEPLLIVVLVLWILSASLLFCGSSASAFCHAPNASGTRSNFKYVSPMCSNTTESSCSRFFAA